MDRSARYEEPAAQETPYIVHISPRRHHERMIPSPSLTSQEHEEEDGITRLETSMDTSMDTSSSIGSSIPKHTPKNANHMNTFSNHHLHRRHYPEYYGPIRGGPTAFSNLESDIYFNGPHPMYSQGPSLGSLHPHKAGASPSYIQHLQQQRLNSPGKSHHVPHYLENIIRNSHSMNKPQHDPELMRKLSKCIIIPENPKDPAAFTVTPGFTGQPKPPWCSSKPVQKIVGTFVILMSLGILAAVLYVNWSSNTFRPMMK